MSKTEISKEQILELADLLDSYSSKDMSAISNAKKSDNELVLEMSSILEEINNLSHEQLYKKLENIPCFFLKNTILKVPQLEEDYHCYLYKVVSVAIREQIEYVYFLYNRSTLSNVQSFKDNEKRFLAFCFTQMPEYYEWADLFASMKGDALDQESSSDIRQMMAKSTGVFTAKLWVEDEKELIKTIFMKNAGGEWDNESWLKLVSLLTSRYQFNITLP